jgi:hypothetical protein
MDLGRLDPVSEVAGGHTIPFLNSKMERHVIVIKHVENSWFEQK